MAGPDYGALGATFKIVRLLQVICLLGCIGMAANFISEMVSNNDEPSKELVGTLSVVSFCIRHCALSKLRCLTDMHRHPLLCYYNHSSH